MTPAEELDRKLHELDVQLRSKTVSRADYRKIRRKAILALEDPHATIPVRRDVDHDDTVENPTPTRPLPPTGAGAGPAATSSTPRRRAVWILSGIGAVLALVLAAASLLRGFEPSSADPPPEAASREPVRDAGAAPSEADLPRAVAERMMNSEWTDADIAAFLVQWKGISPEARRAARDDDGLWLLRGETDRRLGAAIDAAALDPTPEAQSRIDRLTALQGALRPE